MNWEAVGAIGEVVGAVGVIATLFYLAMQVRQNSAVVRASTRQAISTNQWEIGMRVAENPELAALTPLMSSIAAGIPEAELRAQFFLRAILRTYENQYHQFKDGTFDEELWLGYRENMARNFEGSFTREFWQQNRKLYSVDFAKFVDAVLFAPDKSNIAAS